MGPVGSRCGRPASRGGRVRPGLAGNGEVAARARAPQARVRARRRRPPSQGGHGFSGPHHWNGFSGPRRRNGFGGPRRWNGFGGPHRWRRASRPAPGRTCGGRTHSPAGALAPAQGRTQPARTVLVGRENGTYNVDRARTWLRESGRQVQPPCRGVRQLRGSRPLIGWSPCRYVGVSAGGAGAGARAGGGRGGRGGCQWCVHRGPGWRCCTFIPGCWSGWWRHSNVFPPREAEVSRMNVQRGRRCTFILVPRPRPPSRSA